MQGTEQVIQHLVSRAPMLTIPDGALSAEMKKLSMVELIGLLGRLARFPLACEQVLLRKTFKSSTSKRHNWQWLVASRALVAASKKTVMTPFTEVVTLATLENATGHFIQTNGAVQCIFWNRPTHLCLVVPIDDRRT